MTCDCISPACPAPKHVELECSQPSTVKLRSRDWGEGTYHFCTWCAISARNSGMFEGVE
jgi:hypothetical protein